MTTSILRSDNVAEWDPRWFERQDHTPDSHFYQMPRRVVHIDESAIAATTKLYQELLPPDGAILDLMSSWRSHLPINTLFNTPYKSVTGLGMNSDEMADNTQLTDYVVHDLNRDPKLPFADHVFDGGCCAVSIQYLQRPVEVFRDLGRVLKPGAPMAIVFSNRCFPTKAVNIWSNTDDEAHMDLVALYFANAGNWEGITMQVRSEAARGHDPLYAVWARRATHPANITAQPPSPL